MRDKLKEKKRKNEIEKQGTEKQYQAFQFPKRKWTSVMEISIDQSAETPPDGEGCQKKELWNENIE